MKAKKNFNASLSHLRGTFFLTGIVLALLAVMGAFSYTVYERVDKPEFDSIDIAGDEPIVMVETIRPKKLLLPVTKMSNSKFIWEQIEVIVGDPEPDPEEIATDSKADSLVVFEKIDGPEKTDDTILSWIDVSKMAEFKGGEVGRVKFMKKNLKYPDKALVIELERKVEVQFVVWKDGFIRDIQILNHKDGCEILEQEAIRVIEKMGLDDMWIPAEQRDKKVPVRFHLSVEFRL